MDVNGDDQDIALQSHNNGALEVQNPEGSFEPSFILFFIASKKIIEVDILTKGETNG